MVAPTEELAGIEVYAATDGTPVEASALLLPSSANNARVVAFFSHFADLNAWEYAQKLLACREALADVGAELVVIGIGTDAAAAFFAEQLDFPKEQLFADATGACHKALGFFQGPFPELEITPYAKLLAMVAGIGSPSTFDAILRGFTGIQGVDAKWVGQALAQGAAKGRFPADLPVAAFDSVGNNGLRPFELATLRLQNMLEGILVNWGKLAPSDPALTIQQGGTIVVDTRGELIYRYADEGILVYTPVEEMIASIEEATSVQASRPKAQAMNSAGALPT